MPSPKPPLAELRGVGEAVAKKLLRLKIESVDDLIHHYPRRYEDYSNLSPIKDLTPGPVTIKGQIKRLDTRRTNRRGFTLTEAVIDDGSGAVKAVWFNQPYLKTSLPIDTEVYIAGNLEFKFNQYSLQNPTVEKVTDFPKNTARIVPIYPETEGLSSKQIRSFIQKALGYIEIENDVLPAPLIKSHRLLNRSEALKQIHFPASSEELALARRTLAFEELFLLIATGLVIKAEIQTEKSPRIQFDAKLAQEFVTKLPFKLTDGQRKAAWQIIQDMDSTSPMNRLLEGDVGSGKTVVAAMAAVMAVHQGYQVALMAPTEILASQHFQTITDLGTSILTDRIKKWHGGMKAGVRREGLEAISSGQAGLVIGTHALIQADVKFKNLGLVIIDEQHRFGVNQRIELKKKAKQMPHLLTMTATPIPRSLALTVYGDLDISVIRQLPHGRKPIITKLASDIERPAVYQQIANQIKAGRQVYVVCPLISESDKSGAKSVEAEAARLKQSVFKSYELAVLHGRMKAAEKQAVMERFQAGKLDIIVSTTVIEVGVDVPNASVMLIEGAERFGLATLHQLRGRVGRSKHQSYCFLIASNDYQSRERLALMESNSDGFSLAQQDLELRGPGAIYGQQQHGLLDLRLADLSDTALISEVRQAAEAYIADSHNLLEYPQVTERINKLKMVTTLD
jgi:ATP-dependent DNA helicase RecG